MTTKPNKAHKRRKTIGVILIILAILVTAGVFAYNKANDIVAKTLVTKIAAINNSDSSLTSGSSKTSAENLYKKMSSADQTKVKKIVSSHMNATNVQKVTEYLGNNDTAGLKAYAYDNLSTSEIDLLKELYDKYN